MNVNWCLVKKKKSVEKKLHPFFLPYETNFELSLLLEDSNKERLGIMKLRWQQFYNNL